MEGTLMSTRCQQEERRSTAEIRLSAETLVHAFLRSAAGTLS